MKFSTLSANDRVYLDHNATSPLATLVAEQVPLWLENWGNPGSIHYGGRAPKSVLREARERVARLIGAQSLEVVFTSGGTEANNFALKGVFDFLMSKREKDIRRRYVISSVEHPSLRRSAEYLEGRGAEIVIIPVRRNGVIDIDAFERAVDEKTALVSVMLANNETGNVFPVRQLAAVARSRGALFHSDCVQGLGKIAINVHELGLDLASFSAHKFYALKGAGALFVRRGVQLESLIHGGGQERHRRGGTENILSIAAFGAVASFGGEVEQRADQLERLRDHLERRILAEIPNVTVTGLESRRLPNTSSLVLAGVDGETLLMNLDMRGFEVSTGAACSSGSPEPSPVLLAMGLSRAEAQSSLRVGLGWSTTRDEVDRFVDVLKSVVSHLRSFDRMERESHVSH